MKLHFLVLSLALVQLAVSQNNNNQNNNDGIWNNLTPATVDGSPTIQNALAWGVGQTVASAVQAGSIPDTPYDVSGIYYVSQQQQVPQTNYRFEVQVTGSGGQVWRVKCDVNVANGQNNLLRSRSGPESDTRWDQTLQFGAFTFKPTNVYVPATATPPVTTPPATNTTTTPPATNTTNSSSTLASEVWAEVDPNEVDTNQEIQKALNHGVSSVIDLAIENKEFPDTDFDITGIYSVKKQQQTPSTNYRFEVELSSGTGQPFRVKCDVNVDPTTGAMDTYRWLYGGIDAAVWDQEMTLGTYDFLPDEVYLMDENYVDAEEDGLVDLGDGLSLLL